MDPDPNPGGPKTCGSGGSGSGFGSGSATLVRRVVRLWREAIPTTAKQCGRLYWFLFYIPTLHYEFYDEQNKEKESRDGILNF